MRLHMAFTGYETCGPFATFGHTPAPYAFRGLSASGFALPWRTAGVGLSQYSDIPVKQMNSGNAAEAAIPIGESVIPVATRTSHPLKNKRA
jgi:hypothetical protein